MSEKNNFIEKYNISWVFYISIITFILAIIFSLISENLVNRLNIIFSLLTLLVIIVIGIVFDIIGIAVTKAEEDPFHAMASRKIEEAKLAVMLVRNAGPVSNFCNDVVGDISGIVSGAIGASIIFKLSQAYGIINVAFLNTLIAAFTAAFTVGGKAFGRAYALINYEKIVIRIAILLNKFEETFKVKIFKNR